MIDVASCPACIDRLAHDENLRGSSPDLVDRVLIEYHVDDHGDRRKSQPQLRMERRARDDISRRLGGKD